jgi:hypothetical protein
MVNISRYMATLMLGILCLTYEEADPLDVAIIVTIQQAIASLMGTPIRTRIGVRMAAPPRPMSDPRKPIGTDIRPSDSIFSMILSYNMIAYAGHFGYQN